MQASDQLQGMSLDRGLLRQGVDQANIPALLLCLVQLTGDQAWLEAPFAPRRGRGLDDNDTGGLSDEVQRTIRDAAYDAILGWA
ncbi:monooxygenase, partial [Pseudomonas sp. GW531-E2]